MFTLLPKGVQTKLLKFFSLKIFSIYHRCQRHRWCTLSREYLRKFLKKFEMAIKVYSSQKSCDTVEHKSRDFWFASFFLGILEIYRLVCILLWVFGCFECVSSMFCLKLLLILNFTNTVLARQPLEAFLYHRMASCAPKKSIS
jgi:hypothetical protein